MSEMPTCTDACKHERYTPAYVTDPRGWPSYWSVVDGEGKAEILPDGPDGRRSRGLHVFEADMRAAYLTGEAHGYERGKADGAKPLTDKLRALMVPGQDAAKAADAADELAGLIGTNRDASATWLAMVEDVKAQRDALLAERDGAREAIASAQKLWSVDRAALEEARRELARVERACEDHREKASARTTRAEAMAEGLRKALERYIAVHPTYHAVKCKSAGYESCDCGVAELRAALSQPAEGVGDTTKAAGGGAR